jgi:RNA polymerase sigma-70 factor (ECF subfamily)
VEQQALHRLGLDPPLAGTTEDLDRVEELAGLSQMRQEIVNALGALPGDQAYAVQQRVLLERSYLDLADELCVSEQVVRARVSRGLRVMSEALAGSAL